MTTPHPVAADLINDALERAVDKLPIRARPYAKAVVPLLATFGATVLMLLFTGTLTGTTLHIAAAGLGASVLAAAFPNRAGTARFDDDTVKSLFKPQAVPPLLPGEHREDVGKNIGDTTALPKTAKTS